MDSKIKSGQKDTEANIQWFYWTQELLVAVDKFTVRMPMMGPEFATLL